MSAMPEPDPTGNDLECGRCRMSFAYGVPLRVVRQLRSGQRSTPPKGTIWCNHCGAKWEVEFDGTLQQDRAA